MEEVFTVYILTNWNNQVLYTGFTSNLAKRVLEHKSKVVPGFTQKYSVTKLVYYETSENYDSALQREKQIKGWLRRKKIELIESKNPKWDDLSPQEF